MKRKKKRVLFRHKFYSRFFKILLYPLLYPIFHYEIKSKYKIGKDETIVVLSNHQSDLDPILIDMSFSKHLYPLATDTIFHDLGGSLLSHCFGVIPKRKGEADIKTVSLMKEVIEEKGSLLFFPEGNRSYAEFQFHISPNLPLILKSLKSTIVLFNIVGGSGTHPRWKDKHLRKGPFYGEIRKVLKYEEYKDMPNEDLYGLIKDSLYVADSSFKEKYKSKYRAQYLEKMLFVCPKCNSHSSLRSEKEHISCLNCGLTVTFNEDLTLTSKDPSFSFHLLNDWYQYQKKWMKELKTKEGEVLFKDDKVALYSAEPYKRRRLMFEGEMILNEKEMIFGTKRFVLSYISGASPISGNRFSFVYENKQYLVKGGERFNPLKYVLSFHRLDTLIKRENLDEYYKLED